MMHDDIMFLPVLLSVPELKKKNIHRDTNQQRNSSGTVKRTSIAPSFYIPICKLPKKFLRNLVIKHIDIAAIFYIPIRSLTEYSLGKNKPSVSIQLSYAYWYAGQPPQHSQNLNYGFFFSLQYLLCINKE